MLSFIGSVLIAITPKAKGTFHLASMFWDIVPCSPLKVTQRFGGKCRLSLHGRRISQVRSQLEAGRYIPEYKSVHNHYCKTLKLRKYRNINVFHSSELLS
jgi:hypothetical protein